MFERRSLRWPITLGVIQIILVVALIVGWTLVLAFIIGESQRPIYWILLVVGTVFLVLVLLGVVMYLALSVKAVNLNRRQSNFMDSVTHELKSPIASLKLYLQTLNRMSVSPEEQTNFFKYMLDDVERLDHLINHLLDAARLDRQPAGADVEDVELSELLRNIVQEVRLRYRVPESSVMVDARPSVVRARRVDLDMIFRNVIDNAFKYAGDSPEVQITSRVHDGVTSTRVLDNGRGIPHRLRCKVFRRFVRLGMELEREKPGTGLGLYIVDTLVSRLRGKVTIYDRPSENGTAFEIRLPGEAVHPPGEHALDAVATRNLENAPPPVPSDVTPN